MRLCALLFLLVASPLQVSAQQRVSIGDTDLGGVVAGPSGPEAGVWVIAETTDLPTKFAKIVVTDDLGRYLIPDLPRAIIGCGCAVSAWLIHPRWTRLLGEPST